LRLKPGALAKIVATVAIVVIGGFIYVWGGRAVEAAFADKMDGIFAKAILGTATSLVALLVLGRLWGVMHRRG
jgi:hypothetical protein